MTYQHFEEIEFYNEDLDEQIAFTVMVELEQTAPYVPAQIHGPPEQCWPAEGPEFEFSGLYLILNGRHIKVEEKELKELIGEKRTEALLMNAEQKAIEDG